jgi:hypothetical protein
MALPSPSGWEDSLAADRRRPSARWPNSPRIGGRRQGLVAPRLLRLGGGRTCWAHFEFTRMNIDGLTILPKEIEDSRER